MKRFFVLARIHDSDGLYRFVSPRTELSEHFYAGYFGMDRQSAEKSQKELREMGYDALIVKYENSRDGICLEKIIAEDVISALLKPASFE